jgi:hypothetical protein
VVIVIVLVAAGWAPTDIDRILTLLLAALGTLTSARALDSRTRPCTPAPMLAAVKGSIIYVAFPVGPPLRCGRLDI